MQMGFLKTLLILILLTPIPSVIAHDSAGTDTSTSSADYFDYITLFSDGRITRFTKMPIKVYISQVIKESPYLSEIQYAMNAWETAVEGLITFEEIDNVENADIRVSAGEHSLISYLDTRLGTAELIRQNKSTKIIVSNDFLKQGDQSTDTFEKHKESDANDTVEFLVDIILVLQNDGTIKDMSQREMRTVCLHEFGHAVGLWGHSPHHQDVNHATSTAQNLSQRDIDTLIRLYNTAINTPQHDKAIVLLSRELDVKANDSRTHYLLGAIYFDKGDTESALHCFEESLRLDPKNRIATQKLLQTYERIGNQTRAIELLENRLVQPDKMQTQRDSAASYNHLGVLYYRQGMTDKAVQALEKALELSPHDKQSKQNLYRIILEKTLKAVTSKSMQTAATFTEKLLELDPENADTYHLLGKGYAQIGEITKAMDFYQRALKYKPNDKPMKEDLAQCYVSQGLTMRNDKKWDAAIAAYRTALSLDPNLKIATTNLIDAYWQQANAYREVGNTDEAITAYLELQKLTPNQPDILGLLGELYLKKSNFPSAVSAFDKAYTLNPENPQSQQNLIAVYQQYAQHLTERNMLQKAIEQLKKAIALSPMNTNLRLNLVNVYKTRGNFDQAKVEITFILEHDPDNPQAKAALFNMQVSRGNALVKNRKYKEALTVFKGIPESQKSVNIYNMIGYLHSVQSEHLEAVSAFESTLAIEPRNDTAYQNIRAIESQLAAQLFEVSQPAATSSETLEKKAAEPTVRTIKSKLLQVQCSLSICLINRKQPKNALAMFQKALTHRDETEELKTHLVNTARTLVNIYQSRNDTEKRDKIIQWIEPLDGNFKDSLTH